MQLGQFDLFAIVSIAFMGSIGHCIGMCGGFVVAYTTKKLPSTYTITPHLLYNFGRVSSYILLGCLMGFLGGVFSLSAAQSGYIFFIIGIFMVLLGLSLGGWIGFLNLLESKVGIKVTKKFLNYFMQKNNLSSFYAIGVVNGFIPCGLVYFFLASAASTQSWYMGGFVMLIFGLITMISLMSFSYFLAIFREHINKNLITKIMGIVVIIYGIYMSYMGFLSTRGVM